MVEHPVSIEYVEHSSDIDLSLNVTEESISAASIGDLSKKKGLEMESLTTMDENTTDSVYKDLSSNSRVIEPIVDREKDESTSCDPASRSCIKMNSLERSDKENNKDETNSYEISNHASDSCAKVNGFSSKRSSDDDTHEDEIDSQLIRTKCTLRKLFFNDLDKEIWPSENEKINTEVEESISEETKKSSTDLPIVDADSCDKSIHHSSNECRVNGDIPKLCDDISVSPDTCKRKLNPDPIDSDSGSASSSSCPEKRPKIDDSIVPNCNGLIKTSISSEATNSHERKKKTTARKSTGGMVPKTIIPVAEEECVKEQLAEEGELSVPNCNGLIETSISSEVTNWHGRQKQTGARKCTGGVVPKTIIPVAEEECAKEQLAEEGELSVPTENGIDNLSSDFVDVDAAPPDRKRSLTDENDYRIKYTRESMSDETLQNVFKKMKKQLSRRQIEEIALQKFCEMISESSDIGEAKRRVLEAKETEDFRKKQVSSLEKQIHQLKALLEVFNSHARSFEEHGQIIPPKVITRSVGLQVNLDKCQFVKSKPDSPSTRANSADESDERRSSAVMNSQIASSDTGHNSGSSSPRTSSPDIVKSEKTRKSSLPAHDNTAANSKNDTSSLVRNNVVSEMPAQLSAASDDVIVDLTELDDNTDSPPRPSSTATRNGFPISRPRQSSELPVSAKHPAPLPPTPKGPNILGWKLPPPKPNLSIQKSNLAIQMTWDLTLNAEYEPIDKYQIYAYQETAGIPASVSLWKLVGDVESLDLPMACTLTQFVIGYTYHFAVRAVDRKGRHGPFSCPKSIAL